MRPLQIIKDYGSLVMKAAGEHKLPASLIFALIQQESGGDPNAESSCGARGLTQVMEGALTDYNRAHKTELLMSHLFMPQVSIEVGAWYLAKMIETFYGDVTSGVRAYNQGAGRIRKDHMMGKWYSDGVLDKQEKYVRLLAEDKPPNEPSS